MFYAFMRSHKCSQQKLHVAHSTPCQELVRGCSALMFVVAGDWTCWIFPWPSASLCTSLQFFGAQLTDRHFSEIAEGWMYRQGGCAIAWAGWWARFLLTWRQTDAAKQNFCWILTLPVRVASCKVSWGRGQMGGSESWDCVGLRLSPSSVGLLFFVQCSKITNLVCSVARRLCVSMCVRQLAVLMGNRQTREYVVRLLLSLSPYSAD